MIVEGYTGEPYLRFQPDGTVERNRLSTATYLNDDRQGEVDIPADGHRRRSRTPNPSGRRSPTAAPTPGTTTGCTGWTTRRPSVERGEPVPGAYDPWRVPIVVDGAPAEIQGTLVYEEAVSPLPYLGPGGDRRRAARLLRPRSGLRVAAGAARGGRRSAAVVVGWADYSSTPDGGGNPLHWALAAVALVTADRRGASSPAGAAGVVLALASVAALSGWALFRIEVLFKPVLPTELPYALDRTVVALALGVSVGAAVVAVLRSGLSPARPGRRRPPRRATASRSS